MIPFTVEIDDAEVRQALDRLLRSGRDMTPAMQDIGEVWAESTMERFRDGAAPDGTPWAPNTAATLEAFDRKSGGLRKRGPGFGESRRLSTEIVPRAGRDSVALTSSLIYAAVFHFGARKGQFGRTRRGAPIPWGDIPGRPFFGISARDRRDFVDILREHAEDAWSGAP